MKLAKNRDLGRYQVGQHIVELGAYAGDSGISKPDMAKRVRLDHAANPPTMRKVEKR